MKKILILLMFVSVYAAAQDQLVVAQSNPKGTNHDTIATVIAAKADAEKIKFEHVVGKSCVNGVSAWNDATGAAVLIYSSPSARLSASTGIPCVPESNTKSIRVLWTGQVPIYLCGTTTSRPFTDRGVRFSTAPSHADFIKIINASGYSWKFTPATSNESILMLSNGDLDYGLISAAFAEKIKGNPRIRCDYADLPNRDQKSIKSALKLKYDPDPALDATVVIVAKNLSLAQERMLATAINKSNPEFVNGVSKYYQPVPMPKAGQDREYFEKFIEKNKSVGYLLKSIE